MKKNKIKQVLIYTFLCFSDGEENDYHQIGHRKSSLHSQIDYKTPKLLPPVVNKKKPGLFKGIGSMFR